MSSLQTDDHAPLPSKQMKSLFIAGLALQLMIVCGMFFKAQWPIWVGQDVYVKTQPIDPRSLFRGQYVRLGYDFSTIPAEKTKLSRALKSGTVVYAVLTPEVDSSTQSKPLHNLMHLTDIKPTDSRSLFVRGRLIGDYQPSLNPEYQQSLMVRYGIEAFFDTPEQALALEKTLAQGAIVHLKVTDSGHARIQSILSK